MFREFGPTWARPCTSGGSATGTIRNSPDGPTGTCTTLASRGATSPTKSTNPSGGLDGASRPPAPLYESVGVRFSSRSRHPPQLGDLFDHLVGASEKGRLH